MTHTDPQAGASPSDEAPPAAQGADLGRRYVTLLFADLSRSTELAAAMEAEDYAALLAALRQAYQDIMPRHGGLVVRVQGDGLLAMFGHPLTREDDGRRAVEAALALHERVRALRCPVPEGHAISLHTGIHSGLVLIHAGDIERGRFELLGPVPNIASRLSDAAAPHEILVSEETLGPASRAFRTGAVRSLQVKGREAPIRVYSVDARAAPATRLDAHIQRTHAPFVGREAELQRLQQQLEQALAGKPCSVAVAGAAGLGKTRLIEQFLGRAEAQGWRVLRGYCDSELGAEPLQPFRHMLQAAGAQAQGAEAFAEVFAGLAAKQPLLLFIDDVQWADDASRRVLAAVQRLQGCRHRAWT
jgi:class 3 adenylate cyclase